MVAYELLRSFGFILGAALVFAVGTRLVHVPNIVAYILAGLVLGPATGLLEVTHTVELISEFGIILLLFLVGLELSIDTIRDIGATAFVTGGVQMGFTALGGAGVALLFGLSLQNAAFIGVALMFSSTVVVIKLLEQRGDLKATYGKIAVGVLLVQDFVVVIVLTFVAGFSGSDDLVLAEVGRGLARAFIGMTVLGGLVVGAARYVLPRAMTWIASSQEALFLWSLSWCFLVVLAAESLELSPEIGAFLAGIALAQLPYSRDLSRRVHPLVNFFIVIFFVSLGIQMQLGAALSQWPLALTLAAFVLIAKPLLFFWILPRRGYDEETTFLTGLTMAQISEFSLIFAALGQSTGLIGPATLSLITMVGLLTFGLSSFLILYNRTLYVRLRSWHPLSLFGARQRAPASTDEGAPRNHVIVVGMNTLGRHLVYSLHERGERVVAVDSDRAKLEGLPVPSVHGNAVYDDTLDEAGFSRTKLLISALNIEGTNNLLVYRCREAGIPCSVHAFDHAVVDELRALGADHLIHSKQEGVSHLLDALQAKGVLP